MKTVRLKHLTKILRKIPQHNFDLSGWTDAQAPNLALPQEDLIKCGTVCCAVGWACVDPDFNKQGLNWERHREFGLGVPHFDGRTAWHAVNAFFGITNHQAEYLFHAESYTVTTSPKAVVQRIYNLIRNNGQI